MTIRTTYSLKEAAEHTGFNGGQNKFAKYLKEHGYLDADLEPSIAYQDAGLFTGERIYFGPDRCRHRFQVRLTGSGIAHFKKLFTK